VQAAQDPKKEPAPTVERTPEQMQEISAQIRALDLVHKEIYQKLAAGVPIERVLQEADARLRTMSQANQQSLTTLEEALKDPSRLEAAQQMSRATIDARVAKYFHERISKLGRSGDLGEATGYCASLEGAQGGKIRSYPELRGAVEAAKDRVRTQLGIRVEPSGQLVDTLPKIYDTDPKLHSALSISSATVKPSVPLTAEEAKVVMAKDQPIDEKSVAKIKEAKALHDAKLEEIRTSNPEAFKRLDELEGRALEIAKQSQIMEARKIVPGVDYRPENVRVLGKLSESTIAREHAELKAASDAVVRDECAALKAQWPAKERHSRRDR